MWIRRLKVADCAGIASAEVDLEPGLNVLHGPNELGKSSLVQAVRAALLLESGSRAAEILVDWHADAPPTVDLTFETEAQRVWRVRKSFAGAGGGYAYLEFSKDGCEFSQDSRGREVDGKLSEMLGWGIKAPGGRGGRRGMPVSLITTALLGEQGDVVAILKGSLADDPDESGREHLTRALQGLAEDPRMKVLLDSVQEKVDEAFTATGRRRSGQASPWTQLRSERAAADQREREVRQQREESEGARLNAERLQRELLEAQAEADDAGRALTGARTALAQRGEHDEAAAKLARAEEDLDRVRTSIEERDAGVAALSAARTEVVALEAEHGDAERALAHIVPQVEAARGLVREQETGGDEQQRRLREQETENRSLAAVHEEKELERSVDQAKTLAALDADVGTRSAELEGCEAELARDRALLDQAVQATEADEDRLEDLAVEHCCARYLAASRAARTSARELEAVLEQARRAAARTSEAQATSATAAALNAPSAEQMDRLRELGTNLRIAREKLAVGLVAALTLEKAATAEVGVDGVARPVRIGGGERLEFEAERELRFDLPGVGTLHVQGGSRELVAHVETAEERWNAAGKPIFARTGLGSLAELEDLRRRADDQFAAAVALDRQADDARVRAEGVDGLERRDVVARAECERHRQAVAEFLEEGASVEDYIKGLGEPPRDEAIIGNDIAALKDEVRQREELRRQLMSKVEGDLRDIASRRRVLDDKQAELRRADSGWRDVLEDAEERLRDLARRRQEFDAQLEAIRVEATAEVDEAREKLAELEAVEDGARRRLEQVNALLGGKRTAFARLEGEAETLSRAAEREDIDAARADRDRCRETLESLPAVAEAPEIDLVDLERAGAEAKGKVREIESQLGRTEGALETVGGQYIEEQAEQAREALGALNEREHELEVEYEAWKLLGETLKEAQETDAAHLGRVLLQPVSGRMAELTGGRYGEVAIGPELDATGIELGGAEREFGRLSVGTQEQIALLLRISIAEALGVFVILDDQLTQSDERRMAWLRGLLADTAANIQVVVMTCHPEDYGIGPGINVVDLTECLSRSANGGAASATSGQGGEPAAVPDNTKAAKVPSASARRPEATESGPTTSRRKRRTRGTSSEPKEQDLAAALKESLTRKSDS